MRTIEDALSAAKEALKAGDADRMKATEQDVTKAAHKVAEVLYRSTQGPSARDFGAGNRSQGRQGNASTGGDDVIDVEFEDSRKSA